MKALRTIFIALWLACITSPALADKFFAVTPSGSAEMLFAENPPAVVGKLSSKCIDSHWTVVTSSSNELVCEAPLNMGQSVLGQMLMGNSYSTPPRRFFRFNVIEVNGIARAQASGWIELQMAFGQVKRTDFSGPEFHNGAMNFLGSAGGKFPPGTSFPNHAALGFETDEDVPMGKYRGLRAKKITAGMAGERAGLKEGDIVTQVAGKRFKAYDDYLDATAKAAEKPAYEVEVIRDGKPVNLSFERAFRPRWTAQVVAVAETAAGPVATPSSSVADELTKLAKLKADGLLTDAEFEAQKKKLLAQ